MSKAQYISTRTIVAAALSSKYYANRIKLEFIKKTKERTLDRRVLWRI